MSPVWPDWDTIARSTNARANPYARIEEDPLFGVPITPAMMSAALGYERWKQRNENPDS